MSGRYVVCALGATEEDLIAENEHDSLRAARADAKRLIAGDWNPLSVQITNERTGATVYEWASSARGRLWRAELDTLHEAVAKSALRYLSRWSALLSPETLELPRPEAIACFDVARAVGDLVAYARTGRNFHWVDPGSAMAALYFVSIFYSAPLGASSEPADWACRVAGDDVCDGLAEVAGAVLARVQMGARRPVPRTWLAALAGVSLKTVVKATATGDLRSHKSKRAARGDRGGQAALDVDAESARAWLIARGVEGVS